MSKLKRALIMAGGTGGHIFPGLAIAQRFQKEGILVEWLGTSKGLEAKLVQEAGIPIHFISISSIRGKGLKELCLAPWRLLKAIGQAYGIIKKIQPDVVIGMGGFVSGPGGIASVLLRRPLIIHEQNAKAGLTNKWLAIFAKKILQGFPNTFSEGVTIGNPVRTDIAAIAPPTESTHSPMHLLVVGGSLGAAAINQLVPQALAKIPADKRPLVYHQTGEKHLESTVAAYQQVGVTAQIQPFIVKMDEAYKWADIVLCRAGALTISELCAAGLGAILVPFPHAVDDHQTANAHYMVKNKAAYLVQQAALTEEGLADLLNNLSANQCLAMGQAAYQLRKVDAADEVFRICEEICH